MSKFSKCKNIQIFLLFYLNYFNKIVKIKKGKIIPYRKSIFILNKNSIIELKGSLLTNYNCIKKNYRSTIIRLDKNAKLTIEDTFVLYYDCDISIKIGKNVAISHDVTIMDSDAHNLNYDGYKMTKPIVIEDNVWIEKILLLQEFRQQ
jgi:acetyltransferase-like isoleucine patch superfamily enzyme